MGLTFVAFGVSMPDVISSLIVVRQGTHLTFLIKYIYEAPPGGGVPVPLIPSKN